MKKELYIYGAGGLGKEILSMVNALEEWEVKGFFDDGKAPGSVVKGVPVIGGMQALNELKDDVGLILAIGDPAMKEMVAKNIMANVLFPVLIHPSAGIQDASSVQFGPGTIICAGAILTTDITIGSHVLVNLNVTIGHDSTIGSFTSVMPGVNIAGEVSIGERVLLGSGCNVRNRVSIGDRARVGMGAVVLTDVSPGKTVVGIPAK